ncbi:D-inositol-3-phosphate glycosyltransferase [Ornithinimicrobium cavernae]|uniref:D-inositol-3-phosphate glycosyltransferase n=1 Tax=Ornithinimicrobium cavernae TaxID=2666047 RepID=UPI000D69B0BB|nr:D-inositol-3-phosphate glycosyltransferase [Ornithinimicrobium cavernae]
MLSVHTSPLDPPGTGDAGGLNVYVVETARRLAARGTEVEIFTRATDGSLPETVRMGPGILVHHVPAGPYEGLGKDDLPGQLCAFAAGVMRTAAGRPEHWYDVVHSHYWLSGQVGWLTADRWNVPLVHTMHTMARVKNAQLAEGDSAEPPGREIGETQVVEAASVLVANTDEEAGQLVRLYDADPDKVHVVPPGVDLDVFTPGDRAAARRAVGLPEDAQVVLFVGRIQPLKAPDLLVRAAAELVRRDPSLRDRLVVGVLGGPSGTGLARPEALQELTAQLGLSDLVRFVPPVSRTALADWYRAADLVTVPSYNESFGLVAIESLASGTPVVAAAVGGLPVAVGDGGVLLEGHDPARWADAIGDLLADDTRRAALGEAGVRHAKGFGWDRTVDLLDEVYRRARADRERLWTDGAYLVPDHVPSMVSP